MAKPNFHGYWSVAALLLGACGAESHGAPPQTDRTTRGGVAVSDLDERWPDGMIRYNFYDSWYVEENVPQSTRDTFELARQYIEARTPIRFQQTYTTNGDYLMVQREPELTYSHAEIGFKGGETEMWLRDGASSLGVVHELGHTMGLHHEHQRPDRNAFVNIVGVNVDPDRDGDFEVKDAGDVDMLTPYDFHSAMHYARRAGCLQELDLTVNPPTLQCQTSTWLGPQGPITTDNTIVTAPNVDTSPLIPGTQTVFGTNDDLSKHDINALWLMYARSLSMPAPNEGLGSAMVVADFDQDGYADIAIGAPEDRDTSGIAGGAVFVFKGTERTPVPWRRLDSGPSMGSNNAANRFGAALAVGDFDGDGFPDLAVGAPGARPTRGPAASGTVSLFRGGQFMGANFQAGTPAEVAACGAPCGSTTWAPLSPWQVVRAGFISGVTEASGDRFGAAVATADVDGDGNDELFVGAPNMPATPAMNVNGGTGAAFWFTGSSIAAGTPTGDAFSTSSFQGTRNAFGTALASGDFDRDGIPDIAVGAPGGREQVFLFCGVAGPRLLAPGQRIDSPSGVDEFGAALSTGDLFTAIATGDALAVGAPRRRPSGGIESGAVYVYAQRPGPTNCSVGLMATLNGDPSQAERFGHAVIVTELDDDGDDDLVVGAPSAQGGNGRALMIRNDNGTALTALQNLTTFTGARAFGSSFTAGRVKMDPVPFVQGTLPAKSPHLFVGAPLTDELLFGIPFPQSGLTYGYATDSTGSMVRKELGQLTASPWAQ